MKQLLSVLFAILAALPATAQNDRGPMPTNLESKHYKLQATTDAEKAQDLLDFMELVFSTYKALLKPDNPDEIEKRQFTVVLYKDNEEYKASGAPAGSGAYYNGRELVGYFDEFLMKPFFAHEGMHQFTDVTSKNFRAFPMWFTEGIADCIGNSVVKDKKLYMCVRTGAIARMRLPLIQGALKSGKAYPLATLLTLDRNKFMADAGLCYAQSWSFCHFLICYPSYEEKSSQIPNGSFRKNLAIYYELLRVGGTTHQKAWDEAFKGFPLDSLESMWKKYVEKFEGPKLMGFGGRDMNDDECANLGLGKNEGAVLMEKFGEDSVGKAAGCRDGDALVNVNGRALPRDGALNMLRYVLGDWPYNRKLKIEVLRGESKERIELFVVWKK